VRGIRGDYLIGVIQQGEEILLLMDMESVLSGEEKEELEVMKKSP